MVRRLLRVPPLLYRIGLARQAGRRFLLLTTTGRKTGRQHTIALNYVQTPEAVYVFAGWGPRSDWYRNALTNPDVAVRCGTDGWRATARPVRDPADRARLLRLMAERAEAQGPPRPARRVLRLFGFNYDAEVRRSLARHGAVPALELRPASAHTGDGLPATVAA